MNMNKILGLPVLASEHGKDVDNLIIYVHWLMIALFIGWLAYFAFVLFRFHRSRNPKADYVGVKNHASNYVEGAVALIEGVLLIFVAVPFGERLWTSFLSQKTRRCCRSLLSSLPGTFAIPARIGEFGKQEMRFVSETNVFGIDRK